MGIKTIQIDLDQLIDLSENFPIDLRCDNCGTIETHKPISQVGKGSKTDYGWEEYKGKIYHIVIPDDDDAYIVTCTKCGNIVIARWYGYTKISPDDVLDMERKK